MLEPQSYQLNRLTDPSADNLGGKQGRPYLSLQGFSQLQLLLPEVPMPSEYSVPLVPALHSLPRQTFPFLQVQHRIQSFWKPLCTVSPHHLSPFILLNFSFQLPGYPQHLPTHTCPSSPRCTYRHPAALLCTQHTLMLN